MKTIGTKDIAVSSERSELDFDMNRLADNMPIIETIKCQRCGELHERSEETYMTVYGNVCVGERGGILGGGNWSANGVPVNTFCKMCLVTFIENQG